MRHKWMIVGSLLAVAAGLAGARANRAAEDPAPAIGVVGEVSPSRIAALGTVEPLSRVVRVSASPQAEGGRVGRLLVAEGEDVKKGTLLAELDSLPGRLRELQEAEAALAVAAARLRQTEAGVDPRRRDSIRAELAAARERLVLAKAEDRRAAQLARSGSIAVESAERRAAELKVAGLEVERLAALLAEAETVREVDVELNRAEMAEAEVRVQTAQEHAALARVMAPRDGRVLHVIAREGERVGADGLLELGDVSRMVVVAEVYEADMPRIAKGQQARAQLRSAAVELRGQVAEVGHRIGRRVVLDNDPVADSDARVAEVRIQLDQASSAKVRGLTNARVDVLIEAAP